MEFIQNIIEALYAYQLSVYFRMHFVLLIIVGLAILYSFYEEWRLKKIQEEGTTSKCSTKVPYFEYVTNKRKTTEEAVAKLQQSKEYQQYLAQKENPYSRYNQRYDQEDVSEIILSDDSSEDQRKNR